MTFDGVIHSYTSGWQGADVINDPPVPGAIQFLIDAVKVFDVSIYSSRSHQEGGIQAMREYLAGYISAHFESAWSASPANTLAAAEVYGALKFPTHKPAAFISIDDRALQFNGVWPKPGDLLAFQPWYKRSARAPEIPWWRRILSSAHADEARWRDEVVGLLQLSREREFAMAKNLDDMLAQVRSMRAAVVHDTNVITGVVQVVRSLANQISELRASLIDAGTSDEKLKELSDTIDGLSQSLDNEASVIAEAVAANTVAAPGPTPNPAAVTPALVSEAPLTVPQEGLDAPPAAPPQDDAPVGAG